ncbi:NAD(+)/NADH kinase [Patescibacteria group bacterium]|nr:NAD(+)/NADH kinase [Patescibacteria group bacterium]
MTKKIAIFGGSFNPPHVWHREIVEFLAWEFDEVVIVPCGDRRDKNSVNDIPPLHRAVMCDLAFRGLPNVRLDYHDLEQAEFSSNFALQQRYAVDGAEVWHVIGSDLLLVGSDGLTKIQRNWVQGSTIWSDFNWLVIDRPGCDLSNGKGVLPPKSRLEKVCTIIGSSTDIRQRQFEHRSVVGLVQPEIVAYLERYDLYRGRTASSITRLTIPTLRPFVYVDGFNSKAKELAERLRSRTVNLDDANLIITLGGDGTMLRAVIEHWRRRIPFFGLNFGHAGYLMNQAQASWLNSPAELLAELAKLILGCYQVPLLTFSWSTGSGSCSHDFGFNDVYIKASGPTIPAVMDVTVKSRGREWQLGNIMGDGLICATEVGSTGYAFQAGAQWLPLSSEHKWLLIGLCARRLPQVSLDNRSEVIARLQQTDYRAAVLCADNRVLGPVTELRVRLSQIGSAELAFLPDTDLTAKRIDLTFGH